MWRLLTLTSFLCFLQIVSARSYGPYRQIPLGHFKENGDFYFDDKNTGSECGSSLLKCVSNVDCQLQCPPGFTNLTTGGACYFVSQNSTSLNRTFSQGQDFCKSLGSRMLWIEDNRELRSVINLANLTFIASANATANSTANSTASANVAFFLNAEFSAHHGSWIWSGTNDKILWNILLFNVTNATNSLMNIQTADVTGCLSISLPSGLITSQSCLNQTNFICKMGKAQSRCSKSSATRCCYSPTFNFFIQSRDRYEDKAIGNKNFVNLGPDSCRVNVNGTAMSCTTVLALLQLKQDNKTNLNTVARIGSSFFYLANSTDSCLGRNAIISSKEVHAFVMLILATREQFFNSSNPVKIGLTFRQLERKAFWVDGKPETYYEQFWFPGEPTRDASVAGGCAAYVNLLNSPVFLWKLFPASSCSNFTQLCELPVFQHHIARTVDPRVCGKRNEKGILARRVFSIYEGDESNFGEFPWQAAVMHPERSHGELKFKFSCSGALIHKQFVLTSAHCASSMNPRNMVVALGLHDLKDEHGGILEPLILPVVEVITHNHFNIRASFKHDLALLQLGSVVNVTQVPHIGLACLPSAEEVRLHYGKWECFVSGWPSQRHSEHVRHQTLRRKEVEFTSEQFCRSITREHYETSHYSKGYEREQYSDHDSRYRSEDPELLCTKSFDGQCIGDSSPLLVCKKATTFNERPFFAGSYQAPKKSYGSSKQDDKYLREDYIINSYGDSRNKDVWYVIGIGNSLSECSGSQGYGANQYGKEASYGGYNHDSYESSTYRDYSYGDSIGYDSLNSQSYRDPISYNPQSYRDPIGSRDPRQLRKEDPYNNKGTTEVFTSVFEYIRFIHHILDLYP